MTTKSVTYHGQAMFRTRSSSGPWSAYVPAGAIFLWTEASPAEVKMLVDGVGWTYHRELLEKAVADLKAPLVGEIGFGDVKVSRPGMSHVNIHLSNWNGEATIAVLTATVAEFVRLVNQACPDADAVDYDVDSWLKGLLGDAS